jgi:hypothetical protein
MKRQSYQQFNTRLVMRSNVQQRYRGNTAGNGCSCVGLYLYCVIHYSRLSIRSYCPVAYRVLLEICTAYSFNSHHPGFLSYCFANFLACLWPSIPPQCLFFLRFSYLNSIEEWLRWMVYLIFQISTRNIANSFALTVLLISFVKSVSTLDHKNRL